jgi:hypothetical protein
LLLCCCLATTAFGAVAAGPAILYVQGNYATPQTSQSSVHVNYTAAQTAGDLNAVVVGWNDSTATVKSVVDSQGNVYLLAVGPTIVSGSLSQSIYIAKNIAAAVAGNSVTVTFSTSAVSADVRILEYSGADPVNPVDAVAAKTGTSSPTSASVTTTNPTDLILAANIVRTSTTGAGTGFTKRMLTQPDADIVEDQMLQANGSYTANASISTSGAWIMETVALRTPTAAPPVSPAALSCASSSMTGAGTDACTVILSAAAPSAGMTVSLASNNSAIAVPASLSIPAGATSASFATTISAVSTAQTATLTASANTISQSATLQLNAAIPTLNISSSNLTFGSAAVNTPITQSITLSSTGTAAVTVASATVAGTGFKVSGITLPLTLNPNQTSTLAIQFDPSVAGAASGTLTIASNSSTNGSAVIALGGTGVPVLTGLACSNSSMTGAGTDACTISLNAAAASGGYTANLASSSSSVTVPASVTIAAGATSASFSASVASVSTAQAVTLSATAGTSDPDFTLQLNAAVPTLAISSSSLTFGSVAVNTATTQSITLSSTGTAAVTINSATLTGAGFSISGASFPLTVNPNQTATLAIQFDPTAVGASSGALTIASNSSTATSTTVSLSGTGMPVLTAVSCLSASLGFAGTSTCTVTVNPAAPAGGSSITLSSSSTSLSVPASVAIAAGSTSATFTASATTFSANQSISINASYNGVTVYTAINLALPTTISYVQGNYATPQSSASTVSVAYQAAQLAGDLNVIVVGWNDTTATVSSVTDTFGNTYSLAIGPTVVSGALSQSIYYAKNIVSAAAQANTVTIAFSKPATSADIRVVEYSGADPINPVDVVAAKTGTSSPASVSATTVNATDLILAANIVRTMTTTSGTGFTNRMITKPDGDIVEDEMLNTAGSYTATAPLNASGSWIMQMVAFRTPGGNSVPPATLSTLSCASSSMAGAGTDACTVTLSAAAPSTGFIVNLASTSSAVTVPASVTVAAGSASASFSAAVASVSAAQAVTLSASEGTVYEAFSLQLIAAIPTLSVNATSIAFGDVAVNSPATQLITLTSTGGAAVTISSAAVSGTGFSMSGVTFPITLNPNQTATMSVQFDPTTSGTATGQLTIASNSSTNPTSAISLSGTGEVSDAVTLTWAAPVTSPDLVAGYNIYRSVSGGSNYQLLYSVSETQLAYTDDNVQSGQTYDYIVESVDGSGDDSAPSNMASVTIP